VFRPSRERREDDHWLPAKTFVLVLGAVLGLAGMMFDTGWLITTGIVVLGAGVLIAAAGRRR
jgi:hypothetical protein